MIELLLFLERVRTFGPAFRKPTSPLGLGFRNPTPTRKPILMVSLVAILASQALTALTALAAGHWMTLV
ncbi:MAG: hypothetical protein VXV91_08720 [Verrucomicrobiota bacterium]|nr:hypothetical protein [Verrucomicrobiota bacterium]